MGAARKLCLWFLANCEVQLCSALAAISILGVVVVCPIFLDPAIETLVSSFDRGMCQTIHGRFLEGVSNCPWTSCREGCTADIFSCTHILVAYIKGKSPEDMDFSRLNYTKSASNLRRWNIPQQNYSYTLVRDLNLSVILSELQDSMETETDSFLGINLRDELKVGTLLPNPQGCVYPSEVMCVDFNLTYANSHGAFFPCFVSNTNETIVVTTIDKLGAVRNIFYSFIPLIFACGIFTYLFYRVGLICKKGAGKAKPSDEESMEAEAFDSPQKNTAGMNGGRLVDKNGQTNGAPPGIQKKFRKKFLPRRENSSKKRRKGKLFNKKNVLSVKQQLSMKSPTSSRRAPSISVGVSSDDGLNTSFLYSTRTSVFKLEILMRRGILILPHLRAINLATNIVHFISFTSIGSQSNTVPNEALGYTDMNGEKQYRPAYTLEDSTAERTGRQ